MKIELNEKNLHTMYFWVGVYHEEIMRVRNVLAYWAKNPLKGE